jgi:cAMP-dependent protein kinase regulator
MLSPPADAQQSGYVSPYTSEVPDASEGSVLNEVEEEKEREKIKRVGNSKRASFSAGACDAEAIRLYKPPSYPKTEKVKMKITDTIRQHPKMQVLGIDRLSTEQLDEMVMAFQEKKAKENQDVIKQGEEGDCLYVIEQGHFDIYVARSLDDGTLSSPTQVASFGPGFLFGELAIMYNAPRAATVRCNTPTGVLWSLDREPFQMLLKKCGIEKVEQYSGWLTQIDLLKSLNAHEISLLADACETQLMEKDDVIVQQGDAGDAFYILEEGTCAAFFDVDGQEKLVKTYDKQGDYFGELALLNDAPRKATVKALTDAMVLKVEKVSFENILGPIVDRLRANASSYPQYADFL